VKPFFLCSAAALALVACSDKEGTETVQKGADLEQAGPELGDWGLALSDIDPEVDPGDDFYAYVSGKWLDAFEIPEEFSSYGSFTVLFERSEKRVRRIIEDAAGANAPAGAIEQKIGDYFASFIDVDAINAADLGPIADDLARLASLEIHDDIARAMADPALGVTAFVDAWVGVDSKRPDRYIVYFEQSGLGMPNRDYYLQDKFADIQGAYQDFIVKMLTFAGVDGAPPKAQRIYDLERRMAEVHWEPAKRRNRDLTYNLKTRDELAVFAAGAPWMVMLEALGVADQSEFVLREDDAVQNLAAIFGETPVETWRAYLQFHLLSNYAAVLPAEFDDANFEFYASALRGTPQKRERWKRGVAAVNEALGEAIGRIYVERHFPAASKAQMEALVANLRQALDQRLETLAWMGEATRAAAHEKLEKFTSKIGYPEKWEDYSGFEVVRGDAYGNAKRAHAWTWEDDISKLGGPVDKTEWGMTPQTVNAYYSPTRNEIVFPAAILQAPFFDPLADPAVNYGGIGAVIGHEIGHGFDDQGRKSDGDGVLRDWWTQEDAVAFENITGALGAQYETYEPIEGFPVNPDLTMGENIGDLGGMGMAYHAYKLSLGGEEAPVIDGYTGDQRFFMAWAQVWKRVVREERLKNQIATNPHAPARYRVNGVVRNMDAWYEAFDVNEGDDLYLPPEARVKIW